jgi:hypothetical protein
MKSQDELLAQKRSKQLPGEALASLNLAECAEQLTEKGITTLGVLKSVLSGCPSRLFLSAAPSAVSSVNSRFCLSAAPSLVNSEALLDSVPGGARKNPSP